MPKAFRSYVNFVESMSRETGKGVKFLLPMLVGILVIEAVTRYFFNNPQYWSLEMAQFTLGAYFFLGGAYTLLRGGHVKMDAFYIRWSPRKRAIADLATFPLFALYLIMFILGGIINSIESYAMQIHSSTTWGPPLTPIRVIVMIGAVLLFLQLLAFFIKDLFFVLRREGRS